MLGIIVTIAYIMLFIAVFEYYKFAKDKLRLVTLSKNKMLLFDLLIFVDIMIIIAIFKFFIFGVLIPSDIF